MRVNRSVPQCISATCLRTALGNASIQHQDPKACLLVPAGLRLQACSGVATLAVLYSGWLRRGRVSAVTDPDNVRRTQQALELRDTFSKIRGSIAELRHPFPHLHQHCQKSTTSRMFHLASGAFQSHLFPATGYMLSKQVSAIFSQDRPPRAHVPQDR